MYFSGTDKSDRKTFLIPTVGLLTSFRIQAISVGSSGLSRGTGGIKVHAPWAGMGMFWWFGLISPTIICLITLLVNPLIHVHMKSTLITRIAVVAPVLALGSYLYGGIGDRYFVAPIVTSWIVSLVLCIEVGLRLKRSQFMAILVSTLLIF